MGIRKGGLLAGKKNSKVWKGGRPPGVKGGYKEKALGPTESLKIRGTITKKEKSNQGGGQGRCTAKGGFIEGRRMKKTGKRKKIWS